MEYLCYVLMTPFFFLKPKKNRGGGGGGGAMLGLWDLRTGFL